MTHGSAPHQGRAETMGLAHGMIVQELGWDDDVDESLRQEIMDVIDDDLVEESDEAVDSVLLWWREVDGDVADGMVDALLNLAPNGVIWLLTPRRDGAVDPADLAEGATTAGLSLTKSINVSPNWHCHRLVPPKANRR